MVDAGWVYDYCHLRAVCLENQRSTPVLTVRRTMDVPLLLINCFTTLGLTWCGCNKLQLWVSYLNYSWLKECTKWNVYLLHRVAHRLLDRRLLSLTRDLHPPAQHPHPTDLLHEPLYCTTITRRHRQSRRSDRTPTKSDSMSSPLSNEMDDHLWIVSVCN